MSQWTTLAARVGGKWQLPLLVVSTVTLPASVVMLRPNAGKLPLKEASETLGTYISSGAYERAIELGEILVARDDCVDEACAPVHLQMARARFGLARRRSARTPAAGKAVLEHYREAAKYRQRFTAADYEHLGQSLEWDDQFTAALDWYDKSIEAGFDNALELRRHMFILRRDAVDTPLEELNEHIDLFLADAGDDRLDLRLWGIQEKLYVLDALGRIYEGETVLALEEDRFVGSDLQNRFRYYRAWISYRMGRFDEAEARLRTLRNRVDEGDVVNAMAGWLLGSVVLFDGAPQRPLEALSFFEDVVGNHPEGPYVVASRLGMAEAFAYLERHEEAAAAYRQSIEELQAPHDRRLLNRDVVRSSLGVIAERERRAGHLQAALEYAELAASLIDRRNVDQSVVYLQQLGQIQAQFAQRLTVERTREREAPELQVQQADAFARRFDPQELFAAGGETFAELAKIDVDNERRSAQASWQAAEMFGKAGQRRKAIQRYREFSVERPTNRLVPRALLRIGQLHQAAGHLDRAVEVYQDGYRRFPQTLDGIRMLVPMAECYVSMGPDQLDLAEKTLRVVLDDADVFTPDAPEFADALFLLGDVLERQGAYERAIATLDEVLNRYPADPRVWRARFLLADSYRQSGLALRREVADAKFEGEIERIRSESLSRFMAAQLLYRQLIQQYELRGLARLKPLEAVYLRHAYLYEADCYFEAQDYRHALKLYEEAAGMYKRLASGLAAYVQVINCHVFLGQPREARAALARAQVLVKTMSPTMLARRVSPQTREGWQAYFDWLAESELF